MQTPSMLPGILLAEQAVDKIDKRKVKPNLSSAMIISGGGAA